MSNLSVIWCGEHPCKVTKQCMQFLTSYRIHKAWPWANLKVNVKLPQDFDVENIPVKLHEYMT